MKKLFLLLFVLPLLAMAGEVTVTSVTAQQRYPWNGLVDVIVTIQGSAEDMAVTECSFVATNSVTKAAIPIAHITRNGKDSGLGTMWTRKFIWDAKADVGAVKIDDVALTVEAKPIGVQLWENGPYWAECNVGAEKPEECGYYFWWGDTVGCKRNANNGWVSVKEETGFSFNSGNCQTYGKNNSQLQSEGYIDSTGNLVAAHDAATAHLGAPWRMPTDAEFSALINNCDTEWTTHNGVLGRFVKGRGAYASKSIFLPAGGYGDGSGLVSIGSYGTYWSSTPESALSDCARYLYFKSGNFYSFFDYRYYGLSVRPVRGYMVASGGVTTHLSVDNRVVTSVTAQQRYPWNGLVDIAVTIQGTIDDMAVTECAFDATNSATKMAIPVRHVTRNGDDSGSGNVWTRKFIWDAKADLGAVKVDDVELSVDALVGVVQLWGNGPYWATCNVGATKPEEYGYYFWWGDAVGYKRNAGNNGWVSVKDGTEFSFSSGNCPTCGKKDLQLQSDGYIDATGNLVAAHDAATAHLGAPWRMPTEAEFSALINNCTTTWTTRNGFMGRLVKGRGAYASKSIFLPAAGCGYNFRLDNLCKGGYYRSSTPNSEYADFAWDLTFGSDSFDMYKYSGRNYGYSVRPVLGFAGSFKVGASSRSTVHLSLDCRGAKVADNDHPVVYDAAWYTGGATAKIMANGWEIVSGIAGTYAWTPAIDGVNLLTLNVCGDSDEVVGTGQVFILSREDLTDLVIPEGTTEIGEYAFAGGQFTSVTIPNSVTNVAATAFAGCSNIVDVAIGGIPLVTRSLDWSLQLDGSLRSNAILPNERSDLRMMTYGPQQIVFKWKLSAKYLYDYLRWSVDGCLKEECRNRVVDADWVTVTADIPTGQHEITWSYSKETSYDGSWYNGEDCGFVMPISGFGVCLGSLFPDSYAKIKRVTMLPDAAVIPESFFVGCDELERVDVSNFSDWINVTFANAQANPLHTGAALYVDGEEVTELVIPDGTTEIGEYAFAGGQFTSVTIPNSVTNVAATAFVGCEKIVEVSLGTGLSGESEYTLAMLFPDSYASIRSVRLDDGFTKIGSSMFNGCASLEAFTVPPKVTRIGADAFLGCDAIKRVDVASFDQWMFLEFENENANPLVDGATLYVNGQPFGSGASVVDGLTILEGWVVGCENPYVAEIAVPEGVVGIGRFALADLYDLETVRLPSTLKSIATGAFARDAFLDKVEIPDSVVRIGDGAFEDCSWMQTISVGRGAERVGSRAFAGCTKLARIRFEDGLMEIGDCAFSNCWRMMSASLPLSVAHVATTAFKDCDSLTGVNVPTSIAPLSQWFAPVYRQIKDVTIPSGETLVCSNMFKGCSALVSVDIPEGVTNIGGSAFEDCVNLPSVELPSSLQSVGESAFCNCDALTAIGLPDAVCSVGAYAFYDCYRLKDVSLSKNLESLPDYVFDACPQLDSIYVPASVTQLGCNIFGRAMSAVYFIGNAPAYDADVYASTDSGLVTYVKYETKGWDGRPTSRDLPQRWPTGNSYGRAIKTWDPVQFDVTFDAGEGVFYPVESQTYSCEQIMYTAYSLPPFNPVRKGYKFAGWWTEAVGGAEVTPSTGVSSDRPHTLCAHWDESFIVTVRFNACGGTVLPNEIEYTAEVPFGTLPVPTREHYIFTGWYTAASGGSIVRVSSEVPKADRELFAHWSPAHYTIRFNANNGTGATATQSFIYGQDVTLRAIGFSCSGCEFVGWSLTPGGEAVYAGGKTISGLAAIEDGVIDLYAVWTGNVYAVRFDSHGGLGVMPNQTFVLGVPQKLSHCTFTRSGYVFKGWALSTTAEVSYGDGEEVCNLTASKNATVVLFAVWERDPQGEWTVEEYLNCTNLTFTLGGDTPLWYGEKVARDDNVGMMRSGANGDSQTNWIETVVTGAGQIGFWWKANGEYEVSKKGVITRYDYAEFTIDGVSVEEIGDESDWTYVMIPVEGTGSHILRWMYHKDESGSDGDDCAWLSEVSWEPTQVAEPIPELPENPTAEDVQSALAGSADSQLLVHVTDAATYNAYREWALKIGATDVKASPFAWASFATDSAALLAKMPTGDDLKVEEFKPSPTAGSFDFTVSVKDVTIGDRASVDNLKKLFGLEGAESLDAAAFSSENVSLDFREPQDGKLKFAATPAVDNAKSFFMKMKVK